MKAAETIIAWNGADSYPAKNHAPTGAVAVGPFEDECEWSRGYDYTAGAAYVARRKLTGLLQQHHVMLDWYQLVYSYGIDPYVAHLAFLAIDEYQHLIKKYGMGPDRDEMGHDPDVKYGRVGQFMTTRVKMFRIGMSLHVWPIGATNSPKVIEEVEIVDA